MKGILVAAGAATRLHPLTRDRPKCLLEVGGLSILERALGHLGAAGIGELALVTGFSAPRIREAVAAIAPPFPVRFIDNPDWQTTNNAYSLLLSRAFADGEPFLMLDSDIVCEQGVIDVVLQDPSASCLALRPADDLGPEEIKCEVDAAGLVRRIGKEMPPERAAGESIGIERFSGEASTRLYQVLEERVTRRGLVKEWYEASFQQLIDEGLALKAVSTGALRCAEIDTHDDLRAAEALFAAAPPQAAARGAAGATAGTRLAE